MMLRLDIRSGYGTINFMQFEALKVFCDIARYRSFSQAAAVNNLSQSAASQIVLHLEKRLGVQLVDRSVRPLQLTSLGKAYFEGCSDLIDRYQELEAGILQARAQLAGSVQIAAIYSVGLSDMNQFVESFAGLMPQADVRIDYLHPDRVYDRVIDGTADFGLVSFPRKMRELLVLPWREEEMVIACAPGHDLGEHKSIKPANLAGAKIIGFEKGLVIRREIDRFLRKIGASVTVVLEFDNIESIKKAVEIGAGIALLPEPTLRREVKAGSLIALPLADCRMIRPLGIIQHRQHKLGAAASDFIKLLSGTGEGKLEDGRLIAPSVSTTSSQSNEALNGHLRPVKYSRSRS
jgi:DNA-binding transcriptional LysR family regulator